MNETQDRLEERLREQHVPSAFMGDGTPNAHAVCRMDGQPWPCPVDYLLAALRQSQDIEAAAREYLAEHDCDAECEVADRLRAALAPKAEEAPR